MEIRDPHAVPGKTGDNDNAGDETAELPGNLKRPCSRDLEDCAQLAGVIFFPLILCLAARKGPTVGTTKLTRKEILAEDPVHEAIIAVIEFFRVNGFKIGIVAAAAVVLGLGIYGGIQYLGNKEIQAQEQLGKGMDFYHAEVTSDATDDPYSKGPIPTFRSDAAKYQAAAKEFSSIVSGYSYGKASIIARYYLGLTQLKLGQKKEAVQNLESVANNSRDRTVGFLAKKVLATSYFESGNYKGAREILDAMIRDPQCDLPKDDLSIQLSRVLVAMGKRDEAIKVLREASSQGPAFGVFKQQVAAELERLQKTPNAGAETQPAHP
jgi:tetratricopeptide (TPR) repeat protein